LSRHLDCGLHCFGPRVPEEERVKRGVRHNWEQTFNKSQVRLVQSDAALSRKSK
jgi:hypothetical protein